MMKTVTTWEQWQNWAQEERWTMLPFALKYTYISHNALSSGLPSNWLAAWEDASPYSCVLESGKGGRYTFLGLNPVSVVRGKGMRAEVHHLVSRDVELAEGKPLDIIRDWMAPYCAPHVADLPKFSGGAVGFLGYDVVRSLERLPRLAEDDLGLDDYIWMRLNELWVVDQKQQEVYAIIHCPIDRSARCASGPNGDELKSLYDAAYQRALQMKERWEEILSIPRSGSFDEYGNGDPDLGPKLMNMEFESASAVKEGVRGPNSPVNPFSQEQFENAVRRIQEYIMAGDVFQVNLSLRQGFPTDSPPEEIYEWLRRINPSPYMGMLRFPEFQLVSASPELLVKLEQGVMSTRPIAGTRRRGHSPEEDAHMAEELLGSEKERAEHIMLVDLLRNDLGRVAAYGSVNVSELLTIEYYSHVMHLVSEVRAVLPEDKTPYDVIAAVFPGGTITGAPKVRTMEIIEELEPVTRGPYTGSMGWIDYNGNMELNIIIRTLIVKDGVGYIQAGAGIVIDSVPYREYRESHNKAKAAALAVRLSQRDRDPGLLARDRG